MRKFKHTVKDSAGLHARPAGLLVKEAEKFTSDVSVETADGKKADAKRLFALLSLGISTDDVITVIINGSDEAYAEETLKKFLSDKV